MGRAQRAAAAAHSGLAPPLLRLPPWLPDWLPFWLPSRQFCAVGIMIPHMSSPTGSRPRKRAQPVQKPTHQKAHAAANLSWLTDTLATGGDFDYNSKVAAAQLQDLLDNGVRVVIDCRIEDDDAIAWANHPEVEYHHLPEDDYFGHRMSAAHFDKAVEIARSAQLRGAKVFTHCHMGINRGPSTAFAILLDRGYSPEDAFDLIRAKRPIAGIYYAEDALRAHLARSGSVSDDPILQFRQHRDKVFGDDEIDEVAHIIRETHYQRGDAPVW